jgi:UPF0755 protein
VSRKQAEKTAGEIRSKEAGYLELQKKASGKSPAGQLHLGFDTPPPTRADAKKLVETRKLEQSASEQSTTKVVGSVSKDGSIHKTPPVPKVSPVTPHTRKKPSTSLSTAKPAGTAKPEATTVHRRKPVAKAKGKAAHPYRIELSVPVFVAMVVIVALVLGVFIAQLIRGKLWSEVGDPQNPGIIETLYEVVVEPGMSARQVAVALERAQVIESARAFERLLEARGYSTRLQVGTYRFNGPQAYGDVADALVVKNVGNPRNMVIWDGFTLTDIDGLLVSAGLARQGDFVVAAQELAAARGLPFAEGWFLSGRYTVSEGDAARSLAAAMHAALLDAVRPHLGVVSDADLLLSDIIIIASMIQRETNKADEMPQIAGIIYNRLALNMPLGIDATTRYELNDWKNPLKEADLEAQTPYNTRRKTGLPPTGIGSPGKTALEAAIYPALHDWYYYLHGTDSQIHYARTYEEHKENIKRYR